MSRELLDVLVVQDGTDWFGFFTEPFGTPCGQRVWFAIDRYESPCDAEEGENGIDMGQFCLTPEDALKLSDVLRLQAWRVISREEQDND